MEYWIVYDLASGEVRWRGSGSPGTAALQELPEGMKMVVVPQEVVRTPDVDLDALRAYLSVRVDMTAEAVRQRFLTPGAGQAMTYQRKEAEARAWILDNAADTPFLRAEAPARGMTIAQLAAEVVTLADAWTLIGSTIEGLRMGAKAAIVAASTVGAIVAAAAIDWSVIGAQAIA